MSKQWKLWGFAFELNYLTLKQKLVFTKLNLSRKQEKQKFTIAVQIVKEMNNLINRKSKIYYTLFMLVNKLNETFL